MEPITREEKLLAGQKLQPITRKEMFLAKLAGMDVKTPEPVTREEMFLKMAIENGGVDDGDNLTILDEAILEDTILD